MNPTDVQAIIDKYGMPAWEAAQRQVWINAVTDAFWVVGLLIVAIAVWRQWGRAKAWTETVDSFDRDMAWGASWAVTRVIPTLLMFAAALVFNGLIQIVLNPEWAAIQILVSLLPGK